MFITTWLRQDSEAENIRVNSAMVRNLPLMVAEAERAASRRLVTGLKHYLGPFEAYGRGTLPQTPFREQQGRLDIENFYCAGGRGVRGGGQDGFTWSVHRPHTVIGKAVGNAMNMGTTLAVYATLCRETGRPFYFPRLAGAVGWAHRYDRCGSARTAPVVGNRNRSRAQSGIQRCQWRRLSLEVDVEPHCRMVRS